MSLAPAIQYARKRTQTITWKDDDGAAIDLTGATITGIIERAGVQTAITGTLSLVTAASGIFSWAFSAADVAQAGTSSPLSSTKHNPQPWNSMVSDGLP